RRRMGIRSGIEMHRCVHAGQSPKAAVLRCVSGDRIIHTLSRSSAPAGCTMIQSPQSTTSGPSRSAGRRVVLLRLGEVYRGGTPVLLLLDFKAEFLSLTQTTQTGLLHGADVNEDVLPARLGGDEAIAFGRIEPFYGALGHRRAAFLPADGHSRT